MGLLTTVYCSVAEVERFLSSAGVADFADHDQDGSADTDVVEDCINQGTQEMDVYLLERYLAADLATSELISRWCVAISARFLCQRRGNVVPATIEDEFTRLMDPDNGMLSRIARGIRDLPGLDLRDDMRPTHSNLTIDRRYYRSKVRVTGSNSSDAPSELEQKKSLDWYGSFWD